MSNTPKYGLDNRSKFSPPNWLQSKITDPRVLIGGGIRLTQNSNAWANLWAGINIPATGQLGAINTGSGGVYLLPSADRVNQSFVPLSQTGIAIQGEYRVNQLPGMPLPGNSYYQQPLFGQYIQPGGAILVPAGTVLAKTLANPAFVAGITAGAVAGQAGLGSDRSSMPNYSYLGNLVSLGMIPVTFAANSLFSATQAQGLTGVPIPAASLSGQTITSNAQVTPLPFSLMAQLAQLLYLQTYQQSYYAPSLPAAGSGGATGTSGAIAGWNLTAIAPAIAQIQQIMSAPAGAMAAPFPYIATVNPGTPAIGGTAATPTTVSVAAIVNGLNLSPAQIQIVNGWCAAQINYWKQQAAGQKYNDMVFPNNWPDPNAFNSLAIAGQQQGAIGQAPLGAGGYNVTANPFSPVDNKLAANIMKNPNAWKVTLSLYDMLNVMDEPVGEGIVPSSGNEILINYLPNFALFDDNMGQLLQYFFETRMSAREIW